MKRLLLIGDPNSLYVQNYALQLRNHYGAELVMEIFATFAPKRDRKDMPYSSIYGMMQQTGGRPGIRQVLRPFLLHRFLKRRKKFYDVVHVLYCIQDLMFVKNSLKDASSRLILTVFGSDFYQLDGWKRRWFGPVYRSADFVTSNNSRAMEEIGKIYSIAPSKLRICRFGFNALDTLNKFKEIPRSVSRNKLNLPQEKVIVCIGYNYDPIQQHLDILRSIETHPVLLAKKDLLFFLIPMTYGTDPVYKEKLAAALAQFPFQHATFEQFLSEEENAHLRKAPDIMIQLQKSDSLSASTQEHMFAGNVLITGSWLPYDDLREADIHFLTVDDPREIGRELALCLDNLQDERGKITNNPEMIYRMSSWGANLTSWLRLYDEP
jgi:hypothetical protein